MSTARADRATLLQRLAPGYEESKQEYWKYCHECQCHTTDRMSVDAIDGVMRTVSKCSWCDEIKET